ncbi:MAG TPA: DUF6328 family protein, partial [Actinomycetota bacterium]|nr:DUF6328 family protein [Actinomycetota bacterium]
MTDSRSDEKTRVDRELIEFLNELRVALPGVQVLFAFLLTVPFTQRFVDINETQRNVYFAAFIAAACATAFLIAPSAYHRIRFRQGDKEHMLKAGNIMAIIGMVFLALSITFVVFLITDILFEGPVVPLVTAVIAALFAG